DINPEDMEDSSNPWKVRLLWHSLGYMEDRSEIAPLFRTLFLIATLEAAGDVLVSMCLDGRGQAEASAGMHDCYYAALSIESEYKNVKKLRKRIARQPAAAKLAKVPKQGAKRFVYECWRDWQDGKREYASQAKFARDMLDKKGDVLDSQPSIENWCRQWKKGK